MGKLTCQDLMVGDWFKSVDYNSPFRITAIYDDVVQTQADYQSEIDGNWYSEVEIKDLVPIPLTEEILVKNVFYRSPRWHYCETTTDDGFKIYVQLGCGGTIDYVRITKHNSDLMERDLDATVSIHYVHELQHLLRLCGIEKELTI
jgi:hypothetical protein